jgi:hypothetical protein
VTASPLPKLFRRARETLNETSWALLGFNDKVSGRLSLLWFACVDWCRREVLEDRVLWRLEANVSNVDSTRFFGIPGRVSGIRKDTVL